MTQTEIDRSPGAHPGDKSELLADLDALDALFASERNWTKNTLGRLCDGTPTRDVNAACQWCISGGALKVCGSDPESPNRRWRVLLDALNCWWSAPTWNDVEDRTFADVKKLIADTRSRIQSSSDAGAKS